MIAYLWIVFGLAYLAVVKCFLADTLMAKANAVERGTLRRLAVSAYRWALKLQSCPRHLKLTETSTCNLHDEVYLTPAYFKGSPPTPRDRSGDSDDCTPSATSGPCDGRRSRVQVVSSVSFPTDETEVCRGNDAINEVT
ncbi:hypothetical protein ElyMa_005971900 [Elysia marginata]|uniref:Uncharacterized protein n=1 Tax=Elysia marginata TaxID=1093978 RepID=A0AAV4GDA3_9GAST|nr:hypothetical protein ElyMa_005971900 [Elysia marginata]